MMYNGIIKVTIITDDDPYVEEFENESLSINGYEPLGIINKSNKRSRFYETLKEWNEQDIKTGRQSNFTFKTDMPTAFIVKGFRYYIDRIEEDKQLILFKRSNNEIN